MIKKITLLMGLAFLLRLLFIFAGTVSFHYDMARDAFVTSQILHGDLKLLGPPTSTPGLFHGVFYYYFLAPFYLIGKGDPKIVAILLSFVNSLTVIPIVLLSKDFLRNKKLIFLPAILFLISFEAISYAGWISNPAPAMLTIAFYFYFLRVWQKGDAKGLYLATLMAGLSAQFQFFLIYLFFLIPIFGFSFKAKVVRKSVFISLIVILLSLSTFLIAVFKFQNLPQILTGFLNISEGPIIDFRPQFGELFLNYINRLAELFTNNFIPQNILLGGLLAATVLYTIRRNYFLLFCLLSNLPIFIFGGHTNTYANIGLVAPATIGVVLFLENIKNINKFIFWIIISLIFLSNIYTSYKYSANGQVVLVIPNDMNLKNELNLIDQTYKLSEGQPFSINTLTLPLWTNTTWAYLYSWYGKNMYGYVPAFYGHDQIGLLGNHVLPKSEKPFSKTFFIIEPHVGIPEDRYGWEIGSENSKTELIKQYDFGELKLQYRKPKADE